jgi:hypothetical protein
MSQFKLYSMQTDLEAGNYEKVEAGIRLEV